MFARLYARVEHFFYSDGTPLQFCLYVLMCVGGYLYFA